MIDREEADDLPGWAPSVGPRSDAGHLTHTEAAQAVARWLLHKQRHQAATWEVGGLRVPSGEVEMRPRLRRLDDGTMGLVSEPYQPTRGTVLDALGVEARPDRKPALAIAEVKVSRSDLLADLRARKMFGYEHLSPTRLYLAFTPAVVGLDPFGDPATNCDRPEGLPARLDAKMLACEALISELSPVLPDSWGILLVRRISRHNAKPDVYVLRRAARRDAAPDVGLWLGRIASRYSLQALPLRSGAS